MIRVRLLDFLLYTALIRDFSRLRSRSRTPKRDKLLALAFGLRLDLDETQRMLKIGGAALCIQG